MSQSSLDLKQLKAIIAEAEAAQSTLLNSTAELRQLKLEKSQLKSEINEETARLLAERLEKLKNLDTPILKRIAILEEKEKTLISKVAVQYERHEQLVNDNALLDKRIINKDNELLAITTRANELLVVEKTKKSENIVLIDRIMTIQHDLNGLIPQIDSANNELKQIAGSKRALLSDIQQLDKDFSDKKQVHQKELSTILAKVENARLEYDGFVKNTDAEQRNLAERAKNQDDRDKNLRLREMRVNNQEQIIKHNASLLEM